jgi:uncharacterized repeat protein (TIGR01451 family)
LIEHTETLTEKEKVVLYTFKDDVTKRIISDDLELVLDELKKLEVGGGDACPEASLEAIQTATDYVRTRGIMLLVTDASPGDGDIDATIAKLAAKGITLHAVITGDCVGGLRRGKRNQNVSLRRAPRDSKVLSSKKVYSRIAHETGGSFVYIPKPDGSELNAIKFKNSILNIISGAKSSTVTDVVPSTILPASTLDLIINASKTHFNDSSSVSIGNGSITVNEVKLISATQIVANVTVPSEVLPGFYDVSVTTHLGTEIETANGRGALQVIASRGWSEILSVYPFSGTNGSTINIRLSGFDTDFDETTTIEFDWGIEVKEKNILSPTLMTATIDITPEATLGLQTVLVETGNQIAMRVNAFLVLPKTVNNSPMPKITAIKPSQGARGTTLDIEISGEMTGFLNGESFLDFSGDDITTVQSLNVIDATHATATIVIDSNATFGYRNVFVKTGDEIAVLLNGFEIVTEVPELIQVVPSYGFQGNSLEIEITGQKTNFLANESVVNIEGSDITVLSAIVNSPTQLTANVQVDESAEKGGRNVSVTTGSEVAALRDGFNVMPKLAPAQKDPIRELEKAGLYSVGGRIVNQNGNSIKDVMVQVGDQTSTTSELGLWKIVISEGSYTIVATKDGYTFAPKDVTLGNQAFITELTITVLSEPEEPDSYTVWGRIFNENGEPIAGVAVKVGEQTTTTDDTGKWEIADLEAGKYTVIAGHKLHTFTPKEVTLGGMESTTEVKITLGPPRDDDYTIYGIIIDADGNALAGVNVQVDDDNKTVTGNEGKWEITDLLEGDYTIVASKEGYTFEPKDVTLGNQEFITEVVLSPQADHYTVSGTIVDILGNPMAGVTVQVGDKQAVTDSEGQWEITDLLAGDYTVDPTKSGYHFTSKDITLDNQELTTEVALDPATGDFRAFGIIKDKFRAPIADVKVEIYSGTTLVATTETDAKGQWEITGLVEGGYTVIASKFGYVFKARDCFVSENQDCQPALSNPNSLLNVTMDAPKIVEQGDDVTYTITVTNMSEVEEGLTATGIILSDTLPTGTQLVSATPTCSDVVSCTLPDLAPSISTTMTIVVSNSQAERLKNTAIATSAEYPSDLESKWTKVRPFLLAAISASPNPVPMGGELRYEVDAKLSANAPYAATGVELVIRLPNGVKLQPMGDSAKCKISSDFLTITCAVTDLTTENTDSMSHTVTIDVQIIDLDLLVLPIKATVNANEYPSYTVMKHTKVDIPGDVQDVDMAFVIDVTGSMLQEIEGIKGVIIEGLNGFIDEIDDLDPSETPLIALVTFRDDVKVNAFTRDLNVLRKAVGKLKAKGGDACTEASVEALSFVLPYVRKGGVLFFTTDAPPYDNAEVEDVIKLLEGIHSTMVITGDCSKESSWNIFDGE